MVACNRNTVDVWFSNFSPTRPYPFLLMVYTHGPQAFSGKMWTSKKEAERLCAIVIPNQHVSRPFCGLGLGFAIRIPTGWYEAWYNYKQGSSGHRTSHRNPTDLKSWTMPWLVNHIKSDPSPFQLLVSILNLCFCWLSHAPFHDGFHAEFQEKKSTCPDLPSPNPPSYPPCIFKSWPLEDGTLIWGE